MIQPLKNIFFNVQMKKKKVRKKNFFSNNNFFKFIFLMFTIFNKIAIIRVGLF